ncbi:uncharacterized protein LOC115397091 [Salarias fasciatus]|uniref:uncharacterized protein LOC115397091 n=1 Tax=Salarias fasciatus TaxID=181472 RepID=UPI001176E326|nr:uncharacterized protein LOC115397091 [Salarias fasciatus]
MLDSLTLEELDSMQLPLLIYFSLILIVVSKDQNSKDPEWIIDVKPSIEGPSGSTITVQCSFSYPERYRSSDVQVYWKKRGTSICSESDNDKRAFVYHPNSTCVHDDYKGKTELTGDQNQGNCSLKIQNVSKNEPMIYLRISVRNENYSFFSSPVSISVTGNTAVDTRYPTGPEFLPTESSEAAATGEPPQDSKIMYMATFIPVIVVILIVAVILFTVKCKRSQAFTREESKYYANFSRTSSDTTQRKSSGMNVEQTLTEQKVIDEPVYINLQAPTTEMQQDTDHNDHVYGNVDYSK